MKKIISILFIPLLLWAVCIPVLATDTDSYDDVVGDSISVSEKEIKELLSKEGYDKYYEYLMEFYDGDIEAASNGEGFDVQNYIKTDGFVRVYNNENMLSDFADGKA